MTISPSSISVQVLASGSGGNATFLRLGDLRLLVDAGISYKQIVQRLDPIGEHPKRLDAVLVTHEHIDHVSALPMLRKRHAELAFFATRGTVQRLLHKRGWSLDFETIEPGQERRFGDAVVRPFSTRHDVCDSVGYRVDWRGSGVGVVTDLGHADSAVVDALKGCRVLVVEANHDPTMLQDGPYPAHLKRRIASRQGHLSNAQTADLISRVAGPELEHVVLAHLSRKNNTAAFALEEVSRGLGEERGVVVSVASQSTPAPPITLSLS